MNNQKIIYNRIRCKHCGDVIESYSVHDFKFCSCGSVAVDGGHEYLSRSFKVSPEEDFEDLSEVLPIVDAENEIKIIGINLASKADMSFKGKA